MGWGQWDPASPAARYLKELAHVYTRHAKRFTLYGEMLRPARTLNEVPTRSAQWMPDTGEPHRRSVTMPLVVHSLWRAPDGALGLVVTNWGDQALPVDLEVPLSRRRPGAVSARVADLTTGDRVAAVVEDHKLRLTLEVPARRARVLEIPSGSRPTGP